MARMLFYFNGEYDDYVDINDPDDVPVLLSNYIHDTLIWDNGTIREFIEWLPKGCDAEMTNGLITLKPELLNIGKFIKKWNEDYGDWQEIRYGFT